MSDINAGDGFVEIRPDVDPNRFNRELQSKMSPALKSAEGRFKKALSSPVGQVAGGFLAAGGIEAALRGVVSFTKDTIDAALEAEAAQAQLSQALGGTSEALLDQSEALQLLTGFSDEAILEADTLLSRFELTEEQLLKATPIVLDYARAVGKDVPAAASSIGKALLGNARALKEVGVDYTRTGNRAKDFEDILGLLQDKVGGAAESFGGTNAGKLAIFSQRIDEIKEDLGGELLPVIAEVGPEIADAAEALAPLLSEAFHAAITAAGPFIDTLEQIGDLLPSQEGEGKEVSATSDAISKGFDLIANATPVKALSEYNEAVLGFIGFGDDAAETTRDNVGALEVQRGALAAAASATTDAIGPTFDFDRQLRKVNRTLREQERALVDGFRVAPDLFNELADSADLSIRKINRAFRKQLGVQEDFIGNLEELADRHIPTRILEDLSEMGLSAAPLAAELTEATRPQLKRFIDLYSETNRDAKSLADQTVDGIVGIQDSMSALDGSVATIEIRARIDPQLRELGIDIPALTRRVTAEQRRQRVLTGVRQA